LPKGNVDEMPEMVLGQPRGAPYRKKFDETSSFTKAISTRKVWQAKITWFLGYFIKDAEGLVRGAPRKQCGI